MNAVGGDPRYLSAFSALVDRCREPDRCAAWLARAVRRYAMNALLPDGTMEVTRQVRGWVPRGPGPDLTRTERFRRLP
jgi:hypothetical protein